MITVGAVDSTGTIFELSSRGPTAKGDTKPDLVTLGVDVVSALAGSKSSKSSLSGTSMAVPQVSGAAALLLEARPDLEPYDVKRLLLKTADDLGPTGQDDVYGYGALNLTSAIASISAPRPGLSSPVLGEIKLNQNDCPVGDPVMIEAQALGDIRAINADIGTGPDRKCGDTYGRFRRQQHLLCSLGDELLDTGRLPGRDRFAGKIRGGGL